MDHLLETRGQDVYCHRCGKCWDVGDEVPACDEPTWKPITQVVLKAFLVGAASPGCNPALVFAVDRDDAVSAISRPLGIHQSDLVAVAAPVVTSISCKTGKPFWVIAPHQLEAATLACESLLAQQFPGADRVVNPFKMTKRT